MAVATPMHITAPVSDGTLNRVCVSNSIQQIPARAPGNAVMMMNGSSHDWKFTTTRKYTSTIAITSPTPSPKNEDFMVSTCPRTIMRVPRGKGLLEGLQYFHRCLGYRT